MKPRLRCQLNNLKDFANRYSYKSNGDHPSHLKLEICKRGYLTKDDLRMVARWKSPRSSRHIEGNSEDFVQEITWFALYTTNKRARIETLTLLDGVLWPTASVILQFFHRDPYPIIDFRALWSVSLDVPTRYTFEFWQMYVDFCRDLATRAVVNMRTLDRALWQYSKENQKPR
jgi:hypothetical protein